MLIGVDVDDVLADFTPALLKYYNKKYKTNFIRDQVYTYKFWRVFKCKKDKAVKAVTEFLDTPYFDDLEPVPYSVHSVDELSKSNDLVVITSRFGVGIEKTEKWIEEYFPNKFKEIYFSNNTYINDGKEKSKLEICLDLDVNVLVEDSFEYAKECAEKGIDVLLLDAPWNQRKKLPKNIKRIWNWREVLLMLRA